jgi:hypothetical protein
LRGLVELTTVLNDNFYESGIHLGFQELSIDELFELNGGMTFNEFMLRLLFASTSAAYLGTTGAAAGSSLSGGNQFFSVLGGVSGVAYGAVQGWNLGGQVYRNGQK